MVETPRHQWDAILAEARSDNRAVLLPYLTAGLPTPKDSASLFEAMAEAGADGFEVGIPYSDPLMDGPTIQAAGLRAIEAGATLDRSLGIVEDVVRVTGLPTIVMTYANPILSRGLERFARDAAGAGASAVIVADLPVDEAGPFQGAFSAAGLGSVLFAAPTTTQDRLAEIASRDPVFIYGVARLGVTGEQADGSSQVVGLAARVRAVTDAPLVLGVGISTPQQAAEAAAVADGVIVGSALVRRVLDASSPADAAAALRSAVVELAAAVRRTGAH